MHRVRRLCTVLGLDTTDDHWQQARTNIPSTPGIEFDAILRGWLEERTVQDAVQILNAGQVGCSAVITPQVIAEDPDYQAREIYTEWEDLQLGRKMKGIGIIPKFSETPGKIWRGSVPLGHDNGSVYKHILVLEKAELDQLREWGDYLRGPVSRSPSMQGPTVRQAHHERLSYLPPADSG